MAFSVVDYLGDLLLCLDTEPFLNIYSVPCKSDEIMPNPASGSYVLFKLML